MKFLLLICVHVLSFTEVKVSDISIPFILKLCSPVGVPLRRIVLTSISNLHQVQNKAMHSTRYSIQSA